MIDLGEWARKRVGDVGEGPLSRVDWTECARRLQTLASSSGGRWYARGATIDTTAIFDDMVEKLRVRYVITYQSPQPSGSATTRAIEVRAVDPVAAAPVRSPDSGRRASPRLIAQTSYTPTTASAQLLGAGED